MIRNYSMALLAALLMTGCGETGQQMEQAPETPARPVPESAQLIAGRYFLAGESAVFTGCHTGQRWPVAARDAAEDVANIFQSAALPAGDSMVVTVHGEIDILPGLEEGTEMPHLVIYRVQQAPADIDCPVPAASLHGRRWELAEWHEGDDSSLASPPWLVFREDGRVNGFSGCNRFNGEFRLLEQNLEFSVMAMTKKACLDSAMKTEQRLVKLLQRTTAFSQEGDEITLLDGKEKLATLHGVALQ